MKEKRVRGKGFEPLLILQVKTVLLFYQLN